MKRYISSAVNPLENEPVRTRSLFAADPKQSSRVLQLLANDPDELVRFQVAGNRSTPLEILEQLAKDPYNLVRSAVYLNPNIPRELRERIYNSLKDFSGKARVKLCLQYWPDYEQAATFIREALQELGYIVYSDSISVDDIDESTDALYSCVCGEFSSESEVYDAFDVIERDLADIISGLYAMTMLLK